MLIGLAAKNGILVVVQANQRLMKFARGGLSGFALSTVTELQASNPDPKYNRPLRRRPLRSPLMRRRPVQSGSSASVGDS